MRLLATLAIVAAVAAPASAGQFLKAIDDMPLAPGLAETGEAMVFGSDAGRIVRASATGKVDTAKVLAFYRETLPQLGWREAGATLTFHREGDKLELAVMSAKAGETTVAYELVVKLASEAAPG